jgi:hypothetical protein
MYRVIDLAKEAGLLIQVGNYSVGRFTRLFQKNDVLFDLIFRGVNSTHDYNSWLINKTNTDFVKDKLIERIEDKVIHTTIKRRFEIDELSTRNIKKLPYDLDKLHGIYSTLATHYYDLLLKMNGACVHDDLKFLSFIHFDKFGLPTGRPYSYFCSTLNPKKQHLHISPTDEMRPDFLNRVGLPDYFEVYDIKSEFPRVNYLFHTGEWKDDSFDFYSEIIKDTEMIKYLDYQIQRGETKFTNYKDSMKQLFMRIYFGKSTPAVSYYGYYREKETRDPELKDNYHVFKTLENEHIIDLDVWNELCNSTFKVVGMPLGNLVMWYSFFIETEVKIELLKRERVVYNVYDGFYFNSDISREIKKLLIEKSKFVYDKFMQVVKL